MKSLTLHPEFTRPTKAQADTADSANAPDGKVLFLRVACENLICLSHKDPGSGLILQALTPRSVRAVPLALQVSGLCN